MEISNKQDIISKTLVILNEAKKLPGLLLEELKIEIEKSSTHTLRHDDHHVILWSQQNHTTSSVKPYQLPLPYPSRARRHPLEEEHKRFIEQVKGIPVNILFIEAMEKMREYAKYLQDLLNTRQKLVNMSKVFLNEKC